MKKFLNVILLLSVVLALGVVGCAQKPTAANSKDAIEKAKTMESVEAQVSYLVKEANAFMSSKQFDEAVNTAKYVLGKLDKQSAEAKSILEKATDELKVLAEKKVSELKEGANKAISDIKIGK